MNAKNKRIRQLIITLSAAALLYCGIYAHLRTYVWYDTDTLKREMRETIERREDWRLQQHPIP